MQGRIFAARYEIGRQIGAGGMGSVHEAVDVVTRAPLAVKVITADAAHNPTLLGRFEREARAAAAIDTPHITKVLDAGTDEASGCPFLAMELLLGEDLQQLVKRIGYVAPDLALRIVAQACVGLDRAHAARIVHRDIKPANLFLAKAAGGQRVVKLLDFGIAKFTRDPDGSHAETAGLTRTGSLLGSPLYMSPEQARGVKAIDRRTDLWSMGVVLYQTLTGRTPHEDTDALGELIIAICSEEPVPVQERAPWVPGAVAAITHRAMRFSPDERYQSAEEMLDDIRILLPGGWSIDEEMLRPLTDEERARAAPRHATKPDTPVPRGRRAGAEDGVEKTIADRRRGSAVSDTEDSGAVAASTAGEALRASSSEGGAVGAGRPSRPPLATSGRARSALYALGALGVVALAARGFYAQAHRRDDAPAAARITDPGSAAIAAPKAETKPLTVRVVVLPDDASVEVDGTRVEAHDGAIDITGALGSVHRVRVSTADGEAVRDVAVTEGGAIPAKVELASVKPDPAKAHSAKAPAPPAPAPPSPLRLER